MGGTPSHHPSILWRYPISGNLQMVYNEGYGGLMMIHGLGIYGGLMMVDDGE